MPSTHLFFFFWNCPMSYTSTASTQVYISVSIDWYASTSVQFLAKSQKYCLFNFPEFHMSVWTPNLLQKLRLGEQSRFDHILRFRSDSQIKESKLSLNTISCRVPQSSALGPLLFILCINDMHNSIKNCKIHHFVDDTNLLQANSSLKKINRQVNLDFL